MKHIAAVALFLGVCCVAFADDDLPILIKKLSDKNEDVRLDTAISVGLLGPEGKDAVKALSERLSKESVKGIKREVILALGKIGPDAKNAVTPLLTVAAKEPELRPQVGQTVGKIGGDAAVTALKTLLRDKDPGLRVLAATTLGEIGPDAKGAVFNLRAILTDTKEKDPGFRTAVVVSLGKIGPQAKDAVPTLVEILEKDAFLRIPAMEAVGHIGTESKIALNALANVMNDPNLAVSSKAVEALVKIGKPAMPTLSMGLKSKDANLRLIVLRALAAAKADARGAAPELLAMVKDPNPEVAKLSQEVLNNLGKGAVPELVKVIKDKDKLEATRLTAASALAKLEPEKDQLTDLIGLLKDANDEIRKGVAESLSRMGQEVFDALTELVAAMGDTNEDVKKLVGQAIRNTGRRGVPKLVEMLGAEKAPAVRVNLVAALGAMGPLAKEALPDLEKLTQDANKDVREKAVAALESIGRDSVPAQLRNLKNPNDEVRKRAIAVITELGPMAKEAVPVLTQLMINDTVLEVRRGSILALKAIGVKDAKAAIPTLATALKDKEKDVRLEAARFLEEFGADAEPAVAGLIVVLRDPEAAVSTAAADALGKVGPAAVKSLIEALKDGNPASRRGAAAALKDIGPKAKTAVPMLIDALQDEDVQTRQNAAMALHDIGKEATAASLDLIYAMLRDKDPIVRADAALALQTVAPPPHLAIPGYRQALRDPTGGVRDAAIEELTRFGAAAVAELAEALTDRDQIVRVRAADILGAIGKNAKAAVPALKETAAKDADPAVKEAATKALAAIGG